MYILILYVNTLKLYWTNLVVSFHLLKQIIRLTGKTESFKLFGELE